MQIFIMRHGEAQAHAKDDQSRKLTEYGREQAAEQGQWLSEEINGIERVIVSPYTRALETYHQLAKHSSITLPDSIETWEALSPFGNVTLVTDYLQTLYKEKVKSVLIVSHMPFVEDLVSSLCDGPQQVGFSTATIAQIEWDGSDGEFICSNRVS